MISSFLFKKSFLLRNLLFLSITLSFSSCALFEPEGENFRHCHTIILDPGHGGYDSGARTVRGKDEKKLTLELAEQLKPLLEQQGYRVILTRTTDTFIPLGTRTAISNAHPNAIFISLHFNASPKRSARGIEAYYYNPSSKRLAMTIFKELPSSYGAHPRGIKRAPFYVLHHNRRPAVLLELGFVSNRRENKLLQKPIVREHLAEHIAAGIAACRKSI